MPVALPPGRARLVTRPSLTGSSAAPNTIGIVVVWQAIVLAVQPVIFDYHVLAFDVAGFVEAFAERSDIAYGVLGRPAIDETDYRRWLLRARRQRPRRCRAANNGDEFPPPHGAYPKAKDHERSIAGLGEARSTRGRVKSFVATAQD